MWIWLLIIYHEHLCLIIWQRWIKICRDHGFSRTLHDQELLRDSAAWIHHETVRQARSVRSYKHPKLLRRSRKFKVASKWLRSEYLQVCLIVERWGSGSDNGRIISKLLRRCKMALSRSFLDDWVSTRGGKWRHLREDWHVNCEKYAWTHRPRSNILCALLPLAIKFIASRSKLLQVSVRNHLESF